MDRMLRWIAVAMLSLGLVGCDQDAMIAKFAPHPQAEIGRKVLDDLRAGHNDAVRSVLLPAVRSEADDATLDKIRAQLPPGQPDSVRLVGTKSFSRDGKTRYDLTYEYRFGERTMLGVATLSTQGGHTDVLGVHARMLSASLEQINAFGLKGKGVGQWLVLALIVLLPVFSLAVFVICVRTPKFRWKKTWAFFILLGFVTLRLDWTTGDLRLDPLSIQLLSASMVRYEPGPWILGVSFPLGAVLFLFRRRSLPRRSERGPAQPPAP